MVDVDEITEEARAAWREMRGVEPCRESIYWLADYADGHRGEAYDLCVQAALLVGARFCVDLHPLAPIDDDDDGPCFEALLAQWLGLDAMAAREPRRRSACKAPLHSRRRDVGLAARVQPRSRRD